MIVDLVWEGLLSLQNASSVYESDPDRFSQPHVYIYVQNYGPKSAAYIGRADHLAKRLHEHIAGYLGLAYWHRDGDGKWSYESSDYPERFRIYENADRRLEKSLEIALADANRLQFAYAEVPPEMRGKIRNIEASLITTAKTNARDGIELNGRAESAGWNGDPISVTNSWRITDVNFMSIIEKLGLAGTIEWGRGSPYWREWTDDITDE